MCLCARYIHYSHANWCYTPSEWLIYVFSTSFRCLGKSTEIFMILFSVFHCLYSFTYSLLLRFFLSLKTFVSCLKLPRVSYLCGRKLYATFSVVSVFRCSSRKLGVGYYWRHDQSHKLCCLTPRHSPPIFTRLVFDARIRTIKSLE